MTQFKIIGLCVLLIFGSTIALRCGPNEIEIDCATKCVSDSCPKNDRPYESCSVPRKCPNPVCQCDFDYSRAENGTCIPTRLCPPFECKRPNEVYTACPPICSDDCANATPNGECPLTFGFIGIVVPCTPACRCTRGHWRKNGTCIPYSQCPKLANVLF